MMNFVEVQSLVIPEGETVKVECENVALWEQPKKFTNQVPLSIDTDGSIYNGVGYKDNTRIRSGGAEGESDVAVASGFIPFKVGSTLYIDPAFVGDNSGNAINFADSNFNNLGQLTDSGSYYGICAQEWGTYKPENIDGITVFTLTDTHYGHGDIAYIRVTHWESLTNYGADLIVTVDEEITK